MLDGADDATQTSVVRFGGARRPMAKLREYRPSKVEIGRDDPHFCNHKTKIKSSRADISGQENHEKPGEGNTVRIRRSSSITIALLLYRSDAAASVLWP